MSFLQKLYAHVSNDIGIDLGTANSLVYLRGKGVIIHEPSVVALNQKTGQVVAVGRQAKDMLGRTPQHIRAVRPLVNGVVSDFEVTEEMLRYFLNKAQQGTRALVGPRVVIGVPSGITNVESRAVRDAARNAGAREVYIVEEPIAAAIGMRLPIHEAHANMVVDIGGGTTDIAVLALNGLVKSKNLHVAGDRLNADIIAHLRNEFKIVIGETTAEDLKFAVCSVLEHDTPLEAPVRGRDLVTGLPKEVIITDEDVRDAVGVSIDTIIEAIRAVLEESPPMVVSDIMQVGIHLTGGGALIQGVPELLKAMLELPVNVANDPLTSVVRGTGAIVENLATYRELLLDEDVLPAFEHVT
ncbi:MAG: rod shape-determining protein [Candidatus Pacebacteria bacterium]|nr:rod shape-determining protein [Candidatus Paceibacterota bacterium]